MTEGLVEEMRTPPPRVVEALRRGDEVKKTLEEEQRNNSYSWGSDVDWSMAYEALWAMHKKSRESFEALASQWNAHFGDRFGLAVWNRRMSDDDWQHEMTKPLN